MVAIFVALVVSSISLQSSPIGGVHVDRDFELVLTLKDVLNSTDDGPIGHWAREWYHPHRTSSLTYSEMVHGLTA